MGKGEAVFLNDRYYVNLTVSAYKHSAPADEWERSFEFVSELLFAATKKQMQLGEIKFINNGSTSNVHDVDIFNEDGKSRVNKGANNYSFYGTIQLRLPAKREPLITVHELAHYVLRVRDEYAPKTNGTPQCQNNACTGECIMEFARGYGIKLSEDCTTILAPPPPTHHVTDFCFTNHNESLANPQHAIHLMSCWDRIADPDHYEHMMLPNDSDLPDHEIDPINWVPSEDEDKIAFSIVGTNGLGSEETSLTVKAVLKAWVQFTATTGDQAAILLDQGSYRFRDMASISHEELPELLARIDAIDFSSQGDSRTVNIPGLIESQFKGTPGAHQRLILLGPGTLDLDFGFTDLEKLLQQKRLGIIGTSFGTGEFENQLRDASIASRWIDSSQFPFDSQQLDQYSFDLQNSAVNGFFEAKPGFSSGTQIFSRFVAAPALEQGKLKVQKSPPQDALFSDPGTIEVPVYIEQGAKSAFFVLSVPEQDLIKFEVYSPDGRQVDESVEGVRKSPGQQRVTWIHFRNLPSGCYRLKVRRHKPGNELPFHLLVAIENPGFLFNTKIILSESGGKVEFQSQAIYEVPLDYVSASVEIFPADPLRLHQGTAIESLVLQRYLENDPPDDNQVQMSGILNTGSLELSPGEYVAVFRVSNSGQAIFAENVSCAVEHQFHDPINRPVPAFNRIAVQRFVVAED